MTITDSSVWIDFFNGTETPQVAHLQGMLDKGTAALGDLIVFEVLQGFRYDRGVKAANDLFEACDIIGMLSTPLARLAADMYRQLRRRGITLRSPNDAVIAAAVISGSHELLHNDRDFDHFERHLGLQVYHP